MRQPPLPCCLTMLLVLLVLAGCSGASPSLPASAPQSERQTGPGVMAEFDLALDPLTLTAALWPAEREGAALGDTLLLDLGATLKPLCSDCFRLKAVSKGAGGAVNLDFHLRHPFPVEFPRKQYDVFDVRAILLVPLAGPGDAAFPETANSPNGFIATSAGMMPNADGYTTHYTERFPGIFKATIHPFKWFFTEDNPDPLVQGNPIPDHRMSYGQSDIQRIAFVPPSTAPFTLRLILQASYVVAADNRPADEPGGSANPVFFLPEGHLDEACQVEVELIGLPMKAAETRPLTIKVTSSDWQQGAAVDFGFPSLANPAGLDPALGPGGIAGVSLEIPVILYYSETPNTTTGSGTSADPRIDTWNLNFETTAFGTFPLLVSVTDQRQPASLVGRNSVEDLRAFRIAWIVVEP